jgi:hypothetical protein
MTDFEVLGVGPDATKDEIKAAYRRKVRALHPDVHTRRDGTLPPGVTDAFLQLTEARRRALAVRGVTDAAVMAQSRRGVPPVQRAAGHLARPAFPTQRRGTATGRTPAREDDPMLALLTVPQRCATVWSTEALEVWALTVVPAARAHLAEARATVEEARVVLPRHRTAATAHVLLSLTVAGRTSRRYAPLADRLAPAYHALERELPASIVARLPARVTQVGPHGRSTTAVAVGAGFVAGGIAVWADGAGWLLG